MNNYSNDDDLVFSSVKYITWLNNFKFLLSMSKNYNSAFVCCCFRRFQSSYFYVAFQRLLTQTKHIKHIGGVGLHFLVFGESSAAGELFNSTHTYQNQFRNAIQRYLKHPSTIPTHHFHPSTLIRYIFSIHLYNYRIKLTTILQQFLI